MLNNCIIFQLISSAQPNLLRLTKEDDRIYTIFLQMFSNLETNIIKEDDLKSIEAKEVIKLLSSQNKMHSIYIFITKVHYRFLFKEMASLL